MTRAEADALAERMNAMASKPPDVRYEVAQTDDPVMRMVEGAGGWFVRLVRGAKA